jgi:hypothetical protein
MLVGSRTFRSRGRSVSGALAELEHDFALSEEAELRPRNPLDGRGIVSEVGHVDAQASDVAAQLLVFGLDLRKLLVEGAHSGKPFRLQDEKRHRNERDAQDANRQKAFHGAFHGAVGHE